jgi:hypothetical protein
MTLWLAAGLLAAAFLATGLLKTVWSKERILAAGVPWAEDFPPAAIKAVGGLELLGAAGLIGPAFFAQVLVPLAATGLGLIMIGAIVVHARRGERLMIVLCVVLLALAALVALGRSAWLS